MNKHSVMGKLELNGEGQIRVKPDIATVSLTIVTEGKTAEEAVSKPARRAKKAQG